MANPAPPKKNTCSIMCNYFESPKLANPESHRIPVLSFLQYVIRHLWIPRSSRHCRGSYHCVRRGSRAHGGTGSWPLAVHLKGLQSPGKQYPRVPDIGYTNHFGSSSHVRSGIQSFGLACYPLHIKNGWKIQIHTWCSLLTALIYPPLVKHGNGKSPI